MPTATATARDFLTAAQEPELEASDEPTPGAARGRPRHMATPTRRDEVLTPQAEAWFAKPATLLPRPRKRVV